MNRVFLCFVNWQKLSYCIYKDDPFCKKSKNKKYLRITKFNIKTNMKPKIDRKKNVILFSSINLNLHKTLL